MEAICAEPSERLTERSSWRYCPGKENPADLPSRGLTPLELSTSALWRHGPFWMGEGDDVLIPDHTDMPEDCVPEMKRTSKATPHTLLTSGPIVGIGAVMRCQDFSSLPQLFLVMTYVLKFARALVKVLNKGGGSSHKADPTEAERLWIVQSQSALTQDLKFETLKKQFNLFLVLHGIWRCGGRLAEANLSYLAKHPVLLSKYHPLTILMIKNAHKRVGHNGVWDTLTKIWLKYWILKGRNTVKYIIARCVLCKRFEGKPFTAPLPPPLPKFRVQESRPFLHIAIDFVGPLHVKTFGVTKNEKMCICLYTCCVTRAVHIDVIPDMSTETFICSLKRFCARRGIPLVIVSDNAKTFKAAAKVIQDVITHPDVKKYCSDLSFEWRFNLEKGGEWEECLKE